MNTTTTETVTLARTARGQRHHVDIAVYAYQAADEAVRDMWATFPVLPDGTVHIIPEQERVLDDLAADMVWARETIERIYQHSHFVTARLHAITALRERLDTVR